MTPAQTTRPLWRRLLPLIGLGLLAYVLSKINLRAMLDALGRLTWLDLTLAVAAFTANMLLKCLRWQRMLHWQAIELPGRVALAAFFSGQFYGQVTVGRVGELMRAESLIERGISAGRALSACLIDRILDLLVVASTAVVLSALLLSNPTGAVITALTLMALTVLGWFTLSAIATRHRAQTLGEWSTRAAIRRGLDFLVDLLDGARPLLRPMALSDSLLWTGLSWTLYFATLWMLAAGIHVDAGWTLLTAASSLAALSSLLPITVSGLGAREVIFAQMMGTQGVANEAAVLLALLNLAIMMGTTLALGGMGVALRQRQLAHIEAPDRS